MVNSSMNSQIYYRHKIENCRNMKICNQTKLGVLNKNPWSENSYEQIFKNPHFFLFQSNHGQLDTSVLFQLTRACGVNSHRSVEEVLKHMIALRQYYKNQNRKHFIRNLRVTVLRSSVPIQETSQLDFRNVSSRRIPNI